VKAALVLALVAILAAGCANYRRDNSAGFWRGVSERVDR
jgi:hypothetical protein